MNNLNELIEEASTSCITQKSMYDIFTPSKDKAASMGAICVFPEDHQVQLDLDSEVALEEFLKRIHMLGNYFSQEVEYEKVSSKTPGHYHITVNLPITVDHIERLAIQSILGSDPMREMFNLYRYLGTGNPDTCLFKYKE